MGNLAILLQLEGVEQGAQQLDTAVGVVVVGECVDRPYINSTSDQVSGHLVGGSGGIGILEGSCVGGHGNVDGVPCEI